MKESPPAKPGRLYGLDALRGIAALTIVLVHWPFFFDNAGIPPESRIAMLPFRGLLGVVYGYGYLAVDVFFGISGFVFFWLYAGDVAEKRTTLGAFAVRRLSRLYPLHFVTLLIVAAGQWKMHQISGEFLEYQWNDLRHFVLNLFMASSWGFERDMSFNGPAWSVSVEIVLYAAFFAFCRSLPRKSWVMLAVAFASRLVFHGYFPLGRGLWSFFLGGVIAQWYSADRRTPASTRRDNFIVAGTGLLWIASVAAAYAPSQLSMSIAAAAGITDANRATDFVHSVGLNWVRAVLLPATIAAVVILDHKLGTRLRSLEVLGEISYSSYLWHFPLILAVVLAAVRYHIDRAVFGTPIFMAIFMAVLIAWSMASFRLFERPMQGWLRRRFQAP